MDNELFTVFGPDGGGGQGRYLSKCDTWAGNHGTEVTASGSVRIRDKAVSRIYHSELRRFGNRKAGSPDDSDMWFRAADGLPKEYRVPYKLWANGFSRADVAETLDMSVREASRLI